MPEPNKPSSGDAFGALAEVTRDLARLSRETGELAQAHRGHVEFCSEERRREADTRQRLEAQFKQLMDLVGETDNRRREGVQRLHQEIDAVREEQHSTAQALRAEHTASMEAIRLEHKKANEALRADHNAFRLRVLWCAVLALLALLSTMTGAFFYVLEYGPPWIKHAL